MAGGDEPIVTPPHVQLVRTDLGALWDVTHRGIDGIGDPSPSQTQVDAFLVGLHLDDGLDEAVGNAFSQSLGGPVSHESSVRHHSSPSPVDETRPAPS